MLSVHCIPVALAAIDFHRIADGFRMPFQDNYYLWKAIGYGGILIFGSRFFVQWLYSERHKESKVPPIFWWQSLAGTVLCLAYALRQKDSVFMAGYIFNLIPYIRNIMLIRKRNQKLKDDQPQAFVVGSAGK
jgi:lipid-A-disaccharide synthase-like uncharacterized protein